MSDQARLSAWVCGQLANIIRPLVCEFYAAASMRQRYHSWAQDHIKAVSCAGEGSSRNCLGNAKDASLVLSPESTPEWSSVCHATPTTLAMFEVRGALHYPQLWHPAGRETLEALFARGQPHVV
jgi:hypothetical protein